MSKLVFNRDGGKTDEFGHLLALMRFIQGEVIEGLQVAANGTPNMSVNIPYGVAAIPTGSGATAYRYFVGLDATENVAIPTANGSNPRNDLVVLWVDKSVTPNQSVTNNNNNMLKISIVSGTPATTPADPNTAAIQAAIGASNPYIILARVLTGAGVTQINSGNITDLRSLVGVTRLLTDQVTTASVQNLAITTGKVADGAMTNAKIAAGLAAVKLANGALFSAYKNAAQTFSTAGTVAQFGAEDFDPLNVYDTSNGRFTAPVAGYYFFKTHLQLSNGGTQVSMYIQFRKNGVPLAEIPNHNIGTNGGGQGTFLINLAAGDYVDISVFLHTGSFVSVANKPYSNFSGYLVSGT